MTIMPRTQTLPRHQSRRPIELSVLPRVDADTSRRMAEAERALAQLPVDLTLAMSRFVPSSEGYAPVQRELHHELSEAIERVSPILDTTDRRSPGEQRVLQDMSKRLRGGDLRESVLALHAQATGAGVALRHGAIVVRPKGRGALVELPPADIAARQFQRVLDWMATPAVDAPILRASFLYVALLNAHPFEDGNGRLARLLFNHALHQAGMPVDRYLPIFSAMRHSRGGYEIRLRQAEMFGQWDPIVRWFCQVIAITAAAEAA
jgi:hypothetical protein